MSAVRTEMPQGAQLVRYLYQNAPPWARQVPTAGGQTTILHGDPGSGLEEAAAWIAEASVPSVGPVITFDPSLIGDYTTLVHKLVIQIAAAAFGEDAASALGALRRGESRDLSELTSRTTTFSGSPQPSTNPKSVTHQARLLRSSATRRSPCCSLGMLTS